MRAAPFDIVRASHLEYCVPDLRDARDFYVDKLGFHVTAEEKGRLYLRGMEDRCHHCLLLTESGDAGLRHMSFRMRSEADLMKLAEWLHASSIEYIEEEKGERGMGKCIRMDDPFGFPVEFFYAVERVPWLLQRYDVHDGARVMRLDHFNIMTEEVDRCASWYSSLGFMLTEYTRGEGSGMQAAWLRRKQSSHDIAVMKGRGPRFHHAGFIVSDRDDVLDFADVLASSGYLSSIERGPGRHGITNAFFLYLRDPAGNRIELYTGDYLTADPDIEPIVWEPTDVRRQTFWGTPTPESWWKEAAEVRR